MSGRILILAWIVLWALAACGTPHTAVVEMDASPPLSTASGALATHQQATATASPTLLPTVTRTPVSPPSATAFRTPSATPLPTATPTRLPSATPSPSATPADTATAGSTVSPVILGRSVEGRDLEAFRIGQGPLKVVLVGDIHGHFERNTYTLTLQLLDHFIAVPAQVPPEVSLWFIPTLNPDGLAGEARFNARGVDLNRNADTDADGCAYNDWRPDTYTLTGEHEGAGGPFPFSEPELVALREFLDDAHVAIFYHNSGAAIYPGGCLANAGSVRLSAVLSEATGYAMPEAGWTGYPITGGVADYLASEGVAATEIELANQVDLELGRNLEGVRAVLDNLEGILQADAPAAGHVWLESANVDLVEYEAGAFAHPVAMEVLSDTTYLVDGGRVLALESGGQAPRRVLGPGDRVGGALVALPGSAESLPVLEPMALAVAGDDLLALDRAGDVYRYQPATGLWSVERADRAERDTYDHYFVALAASGDWRFLLETTHEKVWRYAASGGRASSGQTALIGAAWGSLPTGRDIDLAAEGDLVWALVRAGNNPAGRVLRYDRGQASLAFSPDIELIHPLQIRLDAEGDLWVLDRMGRRLLELDSATGQVQQILQFQDRRAISAFWVGEGRLILAGRNRLYLYPGRGDVAQVMGGDVLGAESLTHDPEVLELLRGLAVPIEGAHVTRRDFQMPGAPRHYRLGIHEGMDWYGATVGVPVGRDTPVLAVADGFVVRADLDYVSPSRVEMDSWLDGSLRLGMTPDDALDGFRGRQVWVEHAGGLTSRYVHLGAIADGIEVGTPVARGQVLAWVGNSGTPASLAGPGGDVHLHLELWLDGAEGAGGGYVGQFLRPIEIRVWMERLLR